MCNITEDDIRQLLRYIDAHATDLALAIDAEVAAEAQDISISHPECWGQPVING